MSSTGENLPVRHEVLPLFPSLVWKFQLQPDVAEAVNRHVVQYVERTAANAVSERGKLLQSSTDMQLAPEFDELTRRIEAAAGEVMKFLALDPHSHEITGCWFNLGPVGTDRNMHRHPNNFLSGTYYVRTPEGANAITFHDPRPQAGLIAPQPTRLTAHNSGKVTLNIGEGDLLFWHSWLNHSVPPNDSEVERITVSFNIMFTDYTEQHSNPMYQSVLDSL